MRSHFSVGDPNEFGFGLSSPNDMTYFDETKTLHSPQFAIRFHSMPTHPLADCLADCRARRGTGAVTPESSLYPPLEHLLKATIVKSSP
jgi:hypothetical protein